MPLPSALMSPDLSGDNSDSCFYKYMYCDYKTPHQSSINGPNQLASFSKEPFSVVVISSTFSSDPVKDP